MSSFKNAQKTSSKRTPLDAISNAELARRLKDLGQSIGPIVPSTRNIYLKKLTKLLESGEGCAVTQNLYNGQENAQEESPVLPSEKSSTRYRPLGSSVNKGQSTSPPQTSTMTQTDVKGKPKEDVTKIAAPAPQRWLPLWVQVVLVVLIFLFLYLVFQAMENNPDRLSLA